MVEQRKNLYKRSLAAQKKSVAVGQRAQNIIAHPRNQNYKGMVKSSMPKSKAKGPVNNIVGLNETEAEKNNLSPSEEEAFEQQEMGLTGAAQGVFFSPDTLVKPKFKNSKEHYWKHRLVSFGFLKRIHVERLNVFLAKHDYEGQLYLDYVPEEGEIASNASTHSTGPIYNYKFAGFFIPTSIEYRLISNEDIVKQTNDQANCTSILASVFREQITCLTRMPLLPSKFSLGELFQAQSFGILSNPTACQPRNVSAYANVKEMFRAYMNFLVARLDNRANRNERRFEKSRSRKKPYVRTTNANIFLKPSEELFDSLNGTYEMKRVESLEKGSISRFGLRALAAKKLPYFLTKGIGILGGRRTRKLRRH